MTPDAEAEQVESFRALIAERLGLAFDRSKTELLVEVLRRRLAGRACNAGDYLTFLAGGGDAPELSALAELLTVGETYFFRYEEQFRAFVEVVLPERVRARAGQRRLHILSAGCASGDEAYSIAMAVREAGLDPSWELSIRAVDVNPAALAKAAQGRFSRWALRETPKSVQSRWFTRQGSELVVDRALRRDVRFELKNLVDDDPELWRPGQYDAVFCRNVIMYFAPGTAAALSARIAGSLSPGGYLFLGHAETLRGLSKDFELCHSHGTFYYRLTGGAGAAIAHGHQERRSFPPPDPDTGPAQNWADTINAATERIRRLLERRGAAATGPGPDAPWDLSQALDLLQNERFADALGLLRSMPPEAAGDPDVLLLEAVLLVHEGRLEAAEQACQRLLALDQGHAGAHYVLALCREGAGDRRAAAEHDRIAAYLDPAFAMPRLHLGLMARRSGDRRTARRELERAMLLLRREELPRLLLFGGGFRRDALIALCEAELAQARSRS